MKTPRQLERYFKGASNHRRIAILLLLSRKNNMTLDQIAKELQVNFTTTSEHTRRLVVAGLLNKTYRGREVLHSLSPYGKAFVQFAKTF